MSNHFKTEESDMNNWTDELCYYDLCSDSAPNEWNECIVNIIRLTTRLINFKIVRLEKRALVVIRKLS